MVPNDGIQLGNASEAVTMSSDGHQEVLEGLGFEVLGHLHGSSHFLHRFFEKSHFLQLEPQIVPLFARFSSRQVEV